MQGRFLSSWCPGLSPMRGSRRHVAEVKAMYRQRVRSMSSESRHVADAERVSSV